MSDEPASHDQSTPAALLNVVADLCNDAVLIVDNTECGLLVANAAAEALAERSKVSIDELAALLVDDDPDGAQRETESTDEPRTPLRRSVTVNQLRLEVEQVAAPDSRWEVLRVTAPDETIGGSSSSLDVLTDLLDRRSFAQRFERRFAEPARAFALLFVDLDGFKQVNDSLGHVAGDTTLRTIAQRLRSALRDRDLIARYGGDEFVILLDGVTTAAEAAPIVQRLEKTVAEPLADSPPVSASIGVALSVDGYARPEEMLHAADQQMYARKRAAT